MNTVEQPDEPAADLLLYPNPVTDYLSVNLIQAKRLTWRTINAQGQMVQEHQSPALSIQTYIFEATGLFVGWYTLQVVQDMSDSALLSNNRSLRHMIQLPYF